MRSLNTLQAKTWSAFGGRREWVLRAAVGGILAVVCGVAQGQTTMSTTRAVEGPVITAVPASSGPMTPAVPAPEIMQPFVGVVSADHLLVRAGPGKNYYEEGKLNRGDLVNVVGEHLGWYQISPPLGTYCYISKEFVDVDASGTVGSLKVDYVNVRAASALHPGSEYAVLTVARKGVPLTVLGSTDKYYKIVPPENAYVYVTVEFVTRAAEGTEYKAPTIKPAEIAVLAPAGGGTHVAATMGSGTQPMAENGVVIHAPLTPTTEPGAGATEGGATRVAVAPQPTTQYSEDAYTRFSNLNGITQAEFQKPLMQRDLAGLLKDWQALAGQANVPPSVKQSSDSRVEMLQKYLALQEAAKGADVKSDTVFQEKQKAYEEQWKTVEEKLAEQERSGPSLAEGRLEKSGAVKDKYALVNPATGRVAAYVDPVSDIDLSALLGQFIGVRGSVEEDETVRVKVIKVRSATVMAAPATQAGK